MHDGNLSNINDLKVVVKDLLNGLHVLILIISRTLFLLVLSLDHLSTNSFMFLRKIDNI